jgi:Protein of unknown function (DUF1440)
MARNIKRNVLAESPAELAGISNAHQGHDHQALLQNEAEWLEQGKRWQSKKSEARSKPSLGTSHLTGQDEGSDAGRSDTKAEYKEEGSFQHKDRQDRSFDFRADTGENETYTPSDLTRGRGQNLLPSLLIGLGGGALATYVMTQVQKSWSKAEEGNDQQPKPHSEQEREVAEQATVKFADRVAQGTVGHEVPQEQKQRAGYAAHYGFGTLMGGLYGSLASLLNDAPFGTGVLFGVGLWLAADEVILPALGLSHPPQERDAKEHAYEASIHAIYGLCLDAANLLRKRVA